MTASYANNHLEGKEEDEEEEEREIEELSLQHHWSLSLLPLEASEEAVKEKVLYLNNCNSQQETLTRIWSKLLLLNYQILNRWSEDLNKYI